MELVLDDKMLEKVDESAVLARRLIMGEERDNAKIFEKAMECGVGIYLVKSEDYDAFSKIENNKPIIYLNKTLDESRRIYATACELGMIFLGSASKWLLTDYPSDSKSLVHICYKNKDPKIQQDDDRVAERFANVFLFKAAELSKKEIEEKLKSSVDGFYNYDKESGLVASGHITFDKSINEPNISEYSVDKKVEENKINKTTIPDYEFNEKVEHNRIDYHEEILKEKAKQHKLTNKWISGLIAPLLKEVNAKNTFRPIVLIAYALYFFIITCWIIKKINFLQKDGFTGNETVIANFLITGLFVNLIGLVMVIFKYLFDENNTSFLGLNDLIAKVIQHEEENSDK
ncbi:hypothetical protein [Streptococcus equinus]|uniref:Uncharacterized protein n=1 Tax=Streptococcus equinus TaxID=1335 RepID=A0A1G9IMP0_STREI|nr:hypothetical protein [Streptococcus equinus]SDL26431.1 hypothetical protein SAMN05216400_0253 [Streptococcus equinus]